MSSQQAEHRPRQAQHEEQQRQQGERLSAEVHMLHTFDVSTIAEKR